MYYYINSKLKERMLLSYIKREEKTKYNVSIAIRSVLIGAAVVLFSVLMYFGILDGSTEGMILCFFTGIIFGAILVGSTVLIKKRTRFTLGSPYSKRSREFLNVDTMGVEFGYYDELSRYPTNMSVYQIYYEDIQKIEYREEDMMLTITGKGRLIVYDDFQIKRENYEKSQRKFYYDSKYSFILAFDKADEIRKQIENYRKSL